MATRSFWWIFATAFAGGLLALITPCVYSMIPVTVSFFTKRSKTKAEGIKNAISYSTSIIIIFTLLGFLITVIFGPTALNNLATNWIANLIFFLVFFIFGISFLGLLKSAYQVHGQIKQIAKQAPEVLPAFFSWRLHWLSFRFHAPAPSLEICW